MTVRTDITVMYMAVNLASTSLAVGKSKKVHGSNCQITIAGTMLHADRRTFLLNMTSSHVTSVLAVNFKIIGMNSFLQIQPDKKANAKAIITKTV